MMSCEWCVHTPLIDRGLLCIHLSPHLSETNVEACENDVLKKKEKRKKKEKKPTTKKQHQPSKQITNTHWSPQHSQCQDKWSPEAFSLLECASMGRGSIHREGWLVLWKGTDIPWSLETMERGKSKPNLERGKQCWPMSFLCAPSHSELWELSDEWHQSWRAWGYAPHRSALPLMWLWTAHLLRRLSLSSWLQHPARVHRAQSQEPRQQGCLLPASG